jgi:hypothetical protein
MDTNKMPHLIRRRHLNCFDYIYDVIEYTRDYKIIVTTLSTKFGIFVTEEIIKEFNKIIDKKFA